MPASLNTVLAENPAILLTANTHFRWRIFTTEMEGMGMGMGMGMEIEMEMIAHLSKSLLMSLMISRQSEGMVLSPSSTEVLTA